MSESDSGSQQPEIEVPAQPGRDWGRPEPAPRPEFDVWMLFDRPIAQLVSAVLTHGAHLRSPGRADYFALACDDNAPVAAYVRTHSITLALSPEDGQRALDTGGAELERSTRTTWYVRYTTEALGRPDIRPVALPTALRALYRNAPSEAGEDNTVGVHEFLDDLVYSAQWTYGPDDVREYWNHRCATLQELLGIGRVPGGNRGAHASAFLSVVESAPRLLSNDISPFTAFMEAPREFMKFSEPHLARFTALIQEREAALRELLLDGIRHYYPDAISARVPWSDLEARGVAQLPPRDELQVILDGWL